MRCIQYCQQTHFRSEKTVSAFLLFLFLVLANMTANRDIYVPPDVSKLTSDAKKWYYQGITNAEKDLDKFGVISEKIKNGEPFNAELKAQLKELLVPMEDANENTKVLVCSFYMLIIY